MAGLKLLSFHIQSYICLEQLSCLFQHALQLTKALSHLDVNVRCLHIHVAFTELHENYATKYGSVGYSEG